MIRRVWILVNIVVAHLAMYAVSIRLIVVGFLVSRNPTAARGSFAIIYCGRARAHTVHVTRSGMCARLRMRKIFWAVKVEQCRPRTMGNSASHFSNTIEYDAADAATQVAFFRQLMDDVEDAVRRNPHALHFPAYTQGVSHFPRIAVAVDEGRRHVFGRIESVYDVLEEMGCTVHTTDFLEDPFLYPLPHAEYRHAGEYIIRIPASEIECYPDADVVLIPVAEAAEIAIAAEEEERKKLLEVQKVHEVHEVHEEAVESGVAPLDAGSAVAPLDAGSAVAPLDAGSAVAPLDAGSAVAPLDAGSAVAPLEIEAAVASATAPKKRRANPKRAKTSGSV
jgi:hypothetical protein